MESDHPEKRYPVGSLLVVTGRMRFETVDGSQTVVNLFLDDPDPHFLVTGYEFKLDPGALRRALDSPINKESRLSEELVKPLRGKWYVLGLLTIRDETIAVRSTKGYTGGEMMNDFILKSDLRDAVG